jgi:hypothetical protein
LMSRASMSAAAESSTEATTTLSRRAAVCNGVPRVGPLYTFTSAPWRSWVKPPRCPSGASIST